MLFCLFMGVVFAVLLYFDKGDYLPNSAEEKFGRDKKKRRKQADARDEEMKFATVENELYYFLTETVNSKIEILQRKYVSTVFNDEYGVPIFDKWNAELNYFCNRVLVPVYLERAEQDPFIEYLVPIEEAMWVMSERITAHFTSQDFSSEAISVPEDPWEFEKYCADLLVFAGWDASPTKGSGDQGADVIAVSGQRTLVLQCKLYQSAVGNKAVQEIHAAKAHYRATDAVVVATSGYTKSARQLASSTGVLLLHPDELRGFYAPTEF